MAPSLLGHLPNGKYLGIGLVTGIFLWLNINNTHTEVIIKSKYRKAKFELNRIQQAIYKNLVDDLYEGEPVPATLNADKVEDVCLRLEEKYVPRCKAFFTEYYETIVEAARKANPESIQKIDKVDFFAREPHLDVIGRGTYGREVMDRNLRPADAEPAEQA